MLLPARSATEPPARRGSTSRNRPLPTLVGEQSAVVGGAERVEVLPKDGYALGGTGTSRTSSAGRFLRPRSS
jgi:hypothetical protein